MYACKFVCALNYEYYEKMLLSRSLQEKKPYEFTFKVVCKGMTCSLLAFHETSHIRFTHARPVHIKISLTSDASC